MFALMYENLSTIIIGLMIALAIFAIIISMVRNRKKGKSSCGCGCLNCPMSGSCNTKK